MLHSPPPPPNTQGYPKVNTFRFGRIYIVMITFLLTDLKGFVTGTGGQTFGAVQTETDVRVSVGVAFAVRRTGRRRIYRFRVALQISQIQRLDRGGYAVFGALLRRNKTRYK